MLLPFSVGLLLTPTTLLVNRILCVPLARCHGCRNLLEKLQRGIEEALAPAQGDVQVLHEGILTTLLVNRILCVPLARCHGLPRTVCAQGRRGPQAGPPKASTNTPAQSRSQVDGRCICIAKGIAGLPCSRAGYLSASRVHASASHSQAGPLVSVAKKTQTPCASAGVKIRLRESMSESTPTQHGC